MTTIVYESWGDGEYSGSLTKGSDANTKVFCEGESDIYAAANAIFAFIPTTLTDLHSTAGYLLLDKYGPIKRISEYAFECPVSYIDPEADGGEGGGKPDPPHTGEFKIEWDLSTINQKVTFSPDANVVAYIDPALPGDPNPGRAIGVSKHDGKVKVEGVDVRVASLKFSISYRIPKANITGAYVRSLRAKVPRRNNATFLGWGTKELLFVGASGSQAVFGDPMLKLDFETDIEAVVQLGNIPIITKPPHDYLDVMYDTDVDAAAKRLVAKPIAAYVHTFYPLTSFPALFGFGP